MKTPTKFTLLPSLRAPWGAMAMLLALLGGCAPSFRVATPRGFGELPARSAGYDFRAASPHGVALAVRAMPNRERADLDFWTDAVGAHLRRRGGYRVDGAETVRSASGRHTGRRLRFRYGEAGSAATYWVTLFVNDGRVFVLEAGGSERSFAAVRAEVERALASFEPG